MSDSELRRTAAADGSAGPAEESASGIQVISRAVAILRVLKNQDAGLSLGQIAKLVDLPRSTVQRITGALQAEHMLIAASPERGIRLGPEILSLAESARSNVREVLRPYLVQLALLTGETVDLALQRGRQLVFVDQIPGTHRLRAVSFVGETFPLLGTANGKACLALMSDTEIAAILESGSGKNAASRLNEDEFAREIAAIRRTGLAFDRDEHTEGISAAGVAFRDVFGNIFAISIPTPTSRFVSEEQRISQALLDTLHQILELEIVRSPGRRKAASGRG